VAPILTDLGACFVANAITRPEAAWRAKAIVRLVFAGR
jgi:hypothetical protein